MKDTWTIFTDGGSRGNPGPAGYAYVIKRPGQPDIEGKAYLGETTNNIAEYTGMVRALEHAQKLGARKLIVNSDSELMVKQLNGQYRVKNEGLKPLYQRAMALRKQFDSVTIKHIYRDQNSHADELCNEAMEDRSPLDKTHESGLFENAEPETEPIISKVVEPRPMKHDGMTPMMQALALLKRSAAAWSTNRDANDPAPAMVLNEIAAILRQEDAD
jgi:ribonuclease HI